jgi:hypothetical protein
MLFKRMLRSYLFVSLALTVLNCRQAQACECESTFSSCREVKISDLVFIGTVATIEPIFFNRWNGADQSTMRSINDAYIQVQEHPSPEALRNLKDKFVTTFPLDDWDKKLVQNADSVQQMASLFYSSLDRGMRIHLKVRLLGSGHQAVAVENLALLHLAAFKRSASGLG